MYLVTGGTGLVGAHLLYALVQKNKKVRATFRSQKSIERTQNLFSSKKDGKQLFDKIDWVEADILDTPSLNRAFEDVTSVFHCAAFVSFEPKYDRSIMKTNVLGTANMVNLSIANNVKKFVHVSSIAAIGSSTKNGMITEDSEWTEANESVYAKSKYLAELEVWRGSQEGLEVKIVNPGVILGDGFWDSGSGSFFTYAYHNNPMYYLPNGTGFIGVDDLVLSMVSLMESDITNERFITVSDNWSFKKVASLLAKGLGKKEPTKMLPLSWLPILWRLDWVKANVFGGKRMLTKELAHSLKTKTEYDNSKISNRLGLEFSDLEAYTLNCCQAFLKDKV